MRTGRKTKGNGARRADGVDDGDARVRAVAHQLLLHARDVGRDDDAVAAGEAVEAFEGHGGADAVPLEDAADDAPQLDEGEGAKVLGYASEIGGVEDAVHAQGAQDLAPLVAHMPRANMSMARHPELHPTMPSTPSDHASCASPRRSSIASRAPTCMYPCVPAEQKDR